MQAEPRTLQITCYPQFEDATASGAEHTIESVMLLISDETEAKGPGRAGELPALQSGRSQGRAPAKRRTARPAEKIEQLTQQLEEAQAVMHELRTANQELKERNLELQRTNDDLLVSQEEAQAASEEVKTLYEEMQATNEELETLNEEMEATNEELHATNDDLQARSVELQRMVEEREKRRQVSERERAQLAAILLSMADAILVVDAAGQTMLTDDAYRQLFGASDALILLDEMSEEPLPADITLRERAASGAPFTLDFTIPTADRTPRWFEARGQPVDGGNTSLGGVVSIRDITDRTLRRLQERFLTVVSHELRTPLASLLGSLQMLARPSRLQGNAEPLELAIALRQVQQLKMSVDDLSDLGRIQGAKVHLAIEKIDLVPLLERIVTGLNVMPSEDEDEAPPAIVFRALAGSESTFIAGDPLRVEQIVTNLLVNARKYARNSARIDVQLRQVGGMADLQVTDYSPGIPAADQPHVFSPFYQVARSESEAQGGLGLGLFIARGLAEAHGGTLSVHSVEGNGTTFTVRLPLLEQTVTTVATKHHTTSAQQEPLDYGDRAVD